MRRPVPLWAFAAAFLVQIAFLGWIIFDRAMLLARGTEVRLQVVPVDPRDFLRGDYVILSYPISRLDAGQIEGDDLFQDGEPIFVELKKDGETWTAAAIHHTRPSGAFGISGTVDQVLSGTGRCNNADCKQYRVVYQLEQFFVPEGEGRKLEKLRNDQHLQVDVAVGSGGRAALKRLLIDGTPVFQETFF